MQGEASFACVFGTRLSRSHVAHCAASMGIEVAVIHTGPRRLARQIPTYTNTRIFTESVCMWVSEREEGGRKRERQREKERQRERDVEIAR